MRALKFILLFLCLIPSITFGLSKAEPLAVDSRLRVIVYNPNDVFMFKGFYGYESSIVFAGDETVDTITMGDSVAWQVVPNGNRIFLKPVENNATTNMTVITNRRVYHFELHADHATDINDPEMIFAMKFIYSDDANNSSAVQFFSDEDPDEELESDKTTKKKENLNYNYTISGPEFITPVKVFDDGKQTYFKFSDKYAELPAIFVVFDDNSEGLVNYRMQGEYLVIERLAPRYTLRVGNDIGCVFNEKLIAINRNKGYGTEIRKEKLWTSKFSSDN